MPQQLHWPGVLRGWLGTQTLLFTLSRKHPDAIEWARKKRLFFIPWKAEVVEEMLWVFQNTFLKGFGEEEACLTMETGDTVSCFWVSGGTRALWKLPKVVLWCLLCFVEPQRCHTMGATGSVTGIVTTTREASFIYLPFVFQVATGIWVEEIMGGPASGRSISLFTRMRKMGITQSDTFLISFESCWRRSLDLTCSFCTLLSFSPWKHRLSEQDFFL